MTQAHTAAETTFGRTLNCGLLLNRGHHIPPQAKHKTSADVTVIRWGLEGAGIQNSHVLTYTLYVI